MPVKFTTYDVVFLRDGDQVALDDVTVYTSDETRAELEGRRHGLKGPIGTKEGGVTDLGDVVNTEVLKLWSALKRLDEYKGTSLDFRLRDCLGFDKHKDPEGNTKETPLDPTRPAVTGAPDSLAPLSSEDSTPG